MKRAAKWFSVLAVVGLVSGLAFAGAVEANPANPNQGINKGQLAKLSDDWWQWALSIPAAVHPLSFNDPVNSALYCGVGQHGDVWFLGGTLTGDPADRECTIPAGTSIFFPVLNAECSTVEGNGTTEKELRACADGLIDFATEVEATLDGVKLKGVAKSRVQSQLFSFTLPPENVLGLIEPVPNPSPSVSDGYWVLLPPLHVGEHTLSFRGVAQFDDGSKFEQNVTYHLTIVPNVASGKKNR